MEKITATIANLVSESTAHLQGSKKVFLRNADTPTNITQVAYGSFKASDFCEMHTHPTMEECFYFLSGNGIYTVGDQKITLQNGVFVRIPAGIPHRLEAVGDQPLEYVYFGVATE
ncbi:Cupin 2 conserved barrel domain protein [Fibrisoma limi BUZ 3]|uniref:Cupin 2 conserved barrel domain protein n=1 Tax=Fibrisoma limi BUZ 3 TaxID=1185876 RepID=I2GHY5_9BACT|nr:cupin domain-containing protein [Fibrisoma limi]CCH53510.1 Cupin 2 conserved barrel domain protein [Fibrisoma limi BUZ 3]